MRPLRPAAPLLRWLFDLSGWVGLLGPANLPRGIVTQLNARVNEAVRGPLRKPLLDLGLAPAPGTLEEFAAFIREDTAKVAKIVKAANIPPQ